MLTITILAIVALLLLLGFIGMTIIAIQQREEIGLHNQIHKENYAQIDDLQRKLKEERNARILQESDARIDKQDFEAHAQRALAIVAGAARVG